LNRIEKAMAGLKIAKLAFEFPQGKDIVVRLRNLLDAKAPARYSLADYWYSRIVPSRNPNLALFLTSADGKIHQWGSVMHMDSICPALNASDYKMPKMVLVYE